jgi:hypothetical protein
MDASSAAASLYVWLGRFRGVRGRLSDSEATDDVAEEEDALDASESVEDAAAECAGRGAADADADAAAPAALTISRSSRRPAGMQDDAMDDERRIRSKKPEEIKRTSPKDRNFSPRRKPNQIPQLGGTNRE